MEDKENTLHCLEAVLFASGDPVDCERIAAVLGLDTDTVFQLAEELGGRYEQEKRGIRVIRLGEKLQMCSAPEYAGEVTKVLETRRPPKLSRAALEVLAIVAYYQPVTKLYIDRLRGVDSAYTVGLLSERGLIEAVGRLEAPGRPTLYGTGDAFLRAIGLQQLTDLPPLPELGQADGLIELQNKIDNLREKESGTSKTDGKGGAL